MTWRASGLHTYAKTHVPIFGINCVVQGGGPLLTMVHIFDYPAEFSDDPVKQVLSGFGEVRNVKRLKFIGQPDIETGTRLVLMAVSYTHLTLPTKLEV